MDIRKILFAIAVGGVLVAGFKELPQMIPGRYQVVSGVAHDGPVSLLVDTTSGAFWRVGQASCVYQGVPERVTRADIAKRYGLDELSDIKKQYGLQ